MKKLLFVFLFTTTSLFAAITERYVTDAGAGSADGTSEANAMSLATFTDYMVVGGSFTAAAGTRFNIKGSLTARTSTVDTWVNGGTTTSPVIVRGYVTTITDGYQGRTNGNGALILTSLPTFTYTTGRVNITGTFVIVESLLFTSASTSNATFTLGSDCIVRGCKFSNTSTNANSKALEVGVRSLALDCDMNHTAASGGLAAILFSGAGAVDSCRITTSGGSTANGVNLAATGGTLIGNVIYTSGGIGIAATSTTNGVYIRSNTVVGNTSDGIDIVTGATVLQRIVGNMITDNTGHGIDMVSVANAGFLAYNRLRDNSDSINSGTDWVAATSYGQSTTDTGTTGTTTTDYNNYAGGDYTIVFGSPATNAGIFLYSTIGALQPQRTSGSAATSLIYGQ